MQSSAWRCQCLPVSILWLTEASASWRDHLATVATCDARSVSDHSSRRHPRCPLLDTLTFRAGVHTARAYYPPQSVPTTPPPYLESLVLDFVAHATEREWFELKHENINPQEIGEYLSAMSNGAALKDKTHGFVVWGVENRTRRIVGTSFHPESERKGNEPLLSWLTQLLNPKVSFEFHEVIIDGARVVVLQVERATTQPVAFAGAEFIRIGEVKKPLREAPSLERELWKIFARTPFEALIAAERVMVGDIVRLLDCEVYFSMLSLPIPAEPSQLLETLEADGLLIRGVGGRWSITALGAVLLAKRLSDFPLVARKAMRVIQYQGRDRLNTQREQPGAKGYAAGFVGLLEYINSLLPANEVVSQALRRIVPMYPQIAVRELVANALIHQDFSVSGAGPLVEIFEDRLEITNPGQPLLDAQRFLDLPPRSRNERLASLMRRFGVCEERGSGVDKVVASVEHFQLPAPLFEVPDDATRITLYAHMTFREMQKVDRIRACYLHSCLNYVSRKQTTNASLRARFGIEQHNAALVSRALNEALEDGAIKIADPDAGSRNRSYLPFWASASMER